MCVCVPGIVRQQLENRIFIAKNSWSLVRFEVFTAVTMKNGAFGMLRHVATRRLLVTASVVSS
jgi:hypothetical protein